MSLLEKIRLVSVLFLNFFGQQTLSLRECVRALAVVPCRAFALIRIPIFGRLAQILSSHILETTPSTSNYLFGCAAPSSLHLLGLCDVPIPFQHLLLD